MVHLDFHANNALLCELGDTLAVIDWTQIGVSDFRLDLSWTLMIMGDLGQEDWGSQILQAYEKEAGKPVQNLEYFQAASITKLLASSVISLHANPAALGMRPETRASIQRQAPAFLRLYKRLQGITGLSVPEVEEDILAPDRSILS